MLTDRTMHQRLCPETSLLVIIDIQERLLPAILQQQQVIFNARRLLEAASVLGVPVVVTEQYPQGLGKTVPVICSEFNVPVVTLFEMLLELKVQFVRK